jgi:hypothetical protein
MLLSRPKVERVIELADDARLNRVAGIGSVAAAAILSHFINEFRDWSYRREDLTGCVTRLKDPEDRLLFWVPMGGNSPPPCLVLPAFKFSPQTLSESEKLWVEPEPGLSEVAVQKFCNDGGAKLATVYLWDLCELLGVAPLHLWKMVRARMSPSGREPVNNLWGPLIDPQDLVA